MRLSFPLRVFLLLGLWSFTACAQVDTPTADRTPTAIATAPAPAGDKTLRFVEFFSPM